MTVKMFKKTFSMCTWISLWHATHTKIFPEYDAETLDSCYRTFYILKIIQNKNIKNGFCYIVHLCKCILNIHIKHP